MNPASIIAACDFAAVFLLIYGLKRMASPVTARSGIVSSHQSARDKDAKRAATRAAR